MLINKSIPIRYIFKNVKLELVFIFIIALLVYYVTQKYHKLIPQMPLAIPTFLGTAISVILSFKLSQSYDRWWEARKIWGSIVNESRNLILQMQAFIGNENKGVIDRIAIRQIAWCFSLGQGLRGLNSMDGLEKYLSSDDYVLLQAHQNVPLVISQLNILDLKILKDTNKIDNYSHVCLINTIANITNAQGMAERIKGTVFPVTYQIFLHIIIYLFLMMLSISLRGLESYFEIPLLLIIGGLFFLLERTATHLQNPFNNQPTDTAMTSISTIVEINIKQLIGDDSLPELIKPNGFYIN